MSKYHCSGWSSGKEEFPACSLWEQRPNTPAHRPAKAPGAASLRAPGQTQPPGSGGPRDALGALLAPQGRQGLWEAAAPAAGLAGASGFSKGARDPTGWKGLWIPVSVSCRECFGKLRKVVESCKCKSDFLTFAKKQWVIFLRIVFPVPLFLFFYFSSYWKDIHTRLKKQRKQIIIICNSITLRCAKPKIKLQSDLCIFFPVLSYLIFFQISTLKKPDHTIFSGRMFRALENSQWNFMQTIPKFLQQVAAKPWQQLLQQEHREGWRMWLLIE